MDEVTPAFSVAFAPEGAAIWAGYNRTIRAWDVGRPGRDYSTIVTHKKHQEGQPGNFLQATTSRLKVKRQILGISRFWHAYFCQS